MYVFDEGSPKHKQACGFEAISTGLWVERDVMKKMARCSGRALPPLAESADANPRLSSSYKSRCARRLAI